MVKRAALKRQWLSVCAGSNPVPRIKNIAKQYSKFDRIFTNLNSNNFLAGANTSKYTCFEVPKISKKFLGPVPRIIKGTYGSS